MAKQTALELKRKEAREEILTMREKIPTAIVLNFLGRSSQKRGLGYWAINIVILNMVLLSPWLLIGLALDEKRETVSLWIMTIVAVESAISGFALAHIVARNVLEDIVDLIVERINNADDLSKLLHWLGKSWSFRNVSVVALVYCTLWTSLGILSLSVALNEFVGFGLSLTTVLVGLMAGTATYITFWFGLLASNLKNYQYDINVLFPFDSEVVNDITEIMTKYTYILAAYFAVLTLTTTSSLIAQQTRVLFSLPILMIGWILTTAQFILTRVTIGKIVNREKWKTLNKIQVKINAIEEKGDLSDKETAERLLRLADIHKQIMASKTQLFDLKSVSTLFSQLMLPLLGLLLGNLDKILKLLPK